MYYCVDFFIINYYTVYIMLEWLYDMFMKFVSFVLSLFGVSYDMKNKSGGSETEELDDGNMSGDNGQGQLVQQGQQVQGQQGQQGQQVQGQE